ncbi:hypothetical protein OG244_36755 [Streptomyces brevispora]|uniref:hypothetical protein n=1 Tax=Streptomyces brevispora TaxID=887462 RepID=UPI002E32920B|nr:hypothetical protein [Streptomyces brevispora]
MEYQEDSGGPRRIRDLGKVTLYRMGAKPDYEERFPKAGPLLTKKATSTWWPTTGTTCSASPDL